MKTTRILALAGVATLLAASRLVLMSPVSAAPAALSNPRVEKVPGPDFQPTSYFANRKAAYQRDKAAHPEKYAAADTKEPEWFFTGKPYDADSKSYLFLFRNYRPDSASWMQPDPVGFPDGPNNYAYAPVPTCDFDPLGLTSLKEWSIQTGVTPGSDGTPGYTIDTSATHGSYMGYTGWYFIIRWQMNVSYLNGVYSSLGSPNDSSPVSMGTVTQNVDLDLFNGKSDENYVDTIHARVNEGFNVIRYQGTYQFLQDILMIPDSSFAAADAQYHQHITYMYLTGTANFYAAGSSSLASSYYATHQIAVTE